MCIRDRLWLVRFTDWVHSKTLRSRWRSDASWEALIWLDESLVWMRKVVAAAMGAAEEDERQRAQIDQTPVVMPGHPRYLNFLEMFRLKSYEAASEYLRPLEELVALLVQRYEIGPDVLRDYSVGRDEWSRKIRRQ